MLFADNMSFDLCLQLDVHCCLQPMAAEALTYACNHCHRGATQQKARILQFLIPVQMLLGKLPSLTIRQKYNMHMYDTIIEVLTCVKALLIDMSAWALQLLTCAVEDGACLIACVKACQSSSVSIA